MANKRYAFTLLEVVLAIGLTSIVIGLVMTAVEVYLFRSDAGRTEVETAQLARSLLDRMARDLRAARFNPPASSSPSSSGRESSGGNSDQSVAADPTDLGTDRESSDAGGASVAAKPNNRYGLVGTVNELRIDCSARWQWRLRESPDDARSTSSRTEAEDIGLATGGPETVRYFLEDGDLLDPERLAAQGVSQEESSQAIRRAAGLYREKVMTATTLWEANSSLTESSSANLTAADPLPGSLPHLLAPEVHDMQLAYELDGEWQETWNSSEQGDLPQAVEIRLTLRRHAYQYAFSEPSGPRQGESESSQQPTAQELVEYRRVVHLPKVHPLPAFASRPKAGSSQLAKPVGDRAPEEQP